MTFENIIQQISSVAASQKHVLTDGQYACSYEDLPDAFEHLERFFLTHSIRPETCLALECPNSVPGALTLLYLLAKGHGFALLPPSNQGETNLSLKPVPNFCQYRIMINRLPDDASAWQEAPQTFLTVEANPSYRPVDVEQTMGNLYLRTSGSMGASKIVVHRHAKLLGNANNCVQKYHFESEDRVVIPIPISHLYGFGAVFLPAIMVGAAIDLQEHANLLRYLDRECKFNPTIAFMTPALCEMILRGRRTPRPYKVVVTSGQRIKEDVFRAFDAICDGRLVDQYGSSEMGAIAACDPTDPLELRATTIGKPMSDVALRIDRDQGDVAEAEGVGELYCRHAYGFAGYVDEDGNWLQQAEPHAWYATGDLAKTLPNGHIEVVGRADNSLNRSGYLVLFSDIEKTMENVEHIEQVVVVKAGGEGPRGERIAAFCQPAPGVDLKEAQIRELCVRILPNYAIPDAVFVISSWPTLPSGKVDRQALVAMSG